MTLRKRLDYHVNVLIACDHVSALMIYVSALMIYVTDHNGSDIMCYPGQSSTSP